MKVYRVENAQGEGPYGVVDFSSDQARAQSAVSLNLCRKHKGKRHPGPTEDGINFRLVHLFGFASLKSLAGWFTKKERATLKGVGFRIATYEVPERNVLRGAKQVAFIP